MSMLGLVLLLYTASFPVVYQPGVLEAISYDENGREIGRSTLRSANSTRKLTVKADKKTLAANGEDLAYLDIALTDENGIVHVLDDSMISVTVEGCGTLHGLGTGNPKPEEPYDGNVCQSYQGRAQAVIRSGCETGDVLVTIRADGYEDFCVRVNAK